MKLSLVFMLFSILPAVSAGRLLIDSDGTLRNEKHEPQFLTGVVMSHQTTAEITRFGKKFRGCYPEEYRWIYEDVAHCGVLEKARFQLRHLHERPILPCGSSSPITSRISRWIPTPTTTAASVHWD